MGFDVENFGFGLLAGWASAYGIYRARHRIASLVSATRQGASSAQSFATRSADNRYINDMVQMAETSHLAGRFVPLTDILIEPRFIPAPQLAAPPDDDLPPSVFRVVPVVPDHPYLHAPYNIETFSVDDLAAGDRAIAILGHPGSGRTTALMTILLRSLNQVRFAQPEDKIQQRLDAEEAALTDKQRAAAIQERLMIEQRAKERFAEEKGASFDVEADGKDMLPLFNQLMPVYVHLAEINFSDQELGSEVDPAEPLVRAVQRQVNRITASTIPRSIYTRLNKGQVLLLVDGYDDLPEKDRLVPLAWLRAFMEQYGHNFFIITAPVVGHGALTRLGFTPVLLRPWSNLDLEQAPERWAEAWRRISGSRRGLGARPDEERIALAKTNNRALSPLEITLKIWGNYAADAEISGMEGWMRAFISRHLPKDQALGVVLPQLMQAAALQLDEGYITQAHLEALAAGRAAPDSLLAEIEADDAEEAADNAKSGKDKKQDTSAQAKFIAMLRANGLLTRFARGRYQFRHPLICAYIASLTLKESTAEKALDPAWEHALGYAALHSPLDDAVRVRMNSAVDVLNNTIFSLARWLAYASADAPWRTPLLKQLGTMLVAPNQFGLIRERAAAALLETRDRSTVNLFRQALRSPNADVRRLSCLALGAIGEPDAIRDLTGLLQDENMDIQLAAALALGAVETEQSLEALVEALTEGSEQLRQAVAETLALIPDEGYPILYDAIQDDDMMLRRAAVFGLRRIRNPWSLTAIYRTFLEDEQWYVRSAAQIAFQESQQVGGNGPVGYPPVHSISWLGRWAAAKGENLPEGEGANLLLLKAMQEGETDVRVLSSLVTGQLGVVSNTRPLYSLLRDRQPDVREAAHRALADIQLQIGRSLPAPV